MKTISMTAFTRPEYTRQVLEGLDRALEGRRDEWNLIAQIDAPENSAVLDLFNRRKRDYALITVANKHLGCDNNVQAAVELAFASGSDFNLHLEDDTVPSPDVLDLCDWYYNLPERDDYACLNLFSGWKEQLGRPLELAEQFGFCPWGWAVTREMWERYFLPEWNQKKHGGPLGWDWSMSLTIQRHGLKVLRPVLSRVRNIGRDGGTHMTAEHWDGVFPDLPVSDGSYGRDFRITMPLPADYRESKMDAWAREEFAAEKAATEAIA